MPRSESFLNDKVTSVINKALQLDKYAIAQLVSIFERKDSESHELRKRIFAYIDDKKNKHQASIFGWTGTPGAGKSTLLGQIALKLIEVDKRITVAVLAIDPSSYESGGSILGDRTRTNFPIKENRIYFRSQASELDLGGLGRSTFSVTRLLSLLFDVVLIETVGIGQSEIEVRKLADHIVLVVQPFSGDQIQFMKSGIMEIPDTFVINKCDEEKLAQKSYFQLKNSLEFLDISKNVELPKIFLTSSVTGRGLDDLSFYIQEILDKNKKEKLYKSKEEYFLYKDIHQRYGDFGLDILKRNNFSYMTFESYEQAEEIVLELIKKHII